MKSIISITIMTINYVYNEFLSYLNLIINSDDYTIKLERQYQDVKVKHHGFCFVQVHADFHAKIAKMSKFRIINAQKCIPIHNYQFDFHHIQSL